MGIRFRKSVKLPGGVRLNFSKRGVGWSWGVPGYRVTHKAGGGKRKSYSIPHTGISYVKESSSKKSAEPIGEESGNASSQRSYKLPILTFVAGIIVGYLIAI